MPAFGPCRRACGCAGLFFLPPDSAVLSVFVASLFAPSFFPSSVFLLPARISHCPCFSLPVSPTARVSLCPCLPLSVFLSARVSLCPRLSQPASRQLCRAVLLRLYSVWFFFCHFLFFRSSSIARRLLSVARCAVHRPALAACCPSPIVYPLPPIVYPLPPIVHPLPPIVYPLPPIVHPLPPVARNLPPAVHRLLRRPYPVAFICTPSPVPPRLFPLPFGPDHGFCIRGIPACVSAGAACRVVPQRVPSVGLSAKMRPPSVPWSPRRF